MNHITFRSRDFLPENLRASNQAPQTKYPMPEEAKSKAKVENIQPLERAQDRILFEIERQRQKYVDLPEHLTRLDELRASLTSKPATDALAPEKNSEMENG